MDENRFDENRAKIEVRKTVNPDGSYTEIIEDLGNKWAEIREYDAQGDLIRSTYGTFSDEPDVSDEEADDYIDFLLENEKGDEEEFQRWRDQRKEIAAKMKAEEEQRKAERQRQKAKQILAEVQRMNISCSSPPLVGSQEENARDLMKKIEYFRENGIEEKQLHELESKISLFMPDFVAEHFGEFYTFLKKDITSISLAVELLVIKRDFATAKKIADPLVDYLGRHKAELLDNRHCHQNSFETALYTLEEQREIPTWKAGNNYAAFFVTYAKILQNTRAIRNGREVLCIQDSRKYLDWVLELCPQNASAWLYKGISYTDDDEAGLECYKKALRYCYQAGGDYGLGKIYEHMGLYYLRKNQIDVAEALKTMSAALGGEPLALTFLLVKRQQPTRKPYQEVLRKHHIQIGFSQLVQDTADFLSDPRAGTAITPEVRDIISGINGLRTVYGQPESATGAQKTAWFFLQSIGCFLLLPAICFSSVPRVSRGTIPYAADILLRIENASFLIKAGINFCVGLLYILGLGILLFRDALREGTGERRKRNFTMVMLYFSAFVTAGIRFALLLQHGITAGFGVFLIVNIIVHLLFLWSTFSGFKDELEIHREVG